MNNFGVTNNRQEQREAVTAEVALLTARCEEVFNSLVELRRLDPPAVSSQVGTVAVELKRQDDAVTNVVETQPVAAPDAQTQMLIDKRRQVEDIYREIAA